MLDFFRFDTVSLNAKIIPMKTLDDLIKISEGLGKPVIYYNDGKKHTFHIFDENIRYEYILSDNGKIKKNHTMFKMQYQNWL